MDGDERERSGRPPLPGPTTPREAGSWRVEPGSDVPPSRQILEAVLDALARGALGSGERLPSVRGMAAEAMVNHNTVTRAYRDLEQLGVVEGRNGSGVFVTSRGPELARGLRRGATLEAFRRAADEALRAGHTVGELELSLRGAAARRSA